MPSPNHHRRSLSTPKAADTGDHHGGETLSSSSPAGRRGGVSGSSFFGFFARLRPSNRSEQGGTLRQAGFWEQQEMEINSANALIGEDRDRDKLNRADAASLGRSTSRQVSSGRGPNTPVVVPRRVQSSKARLRRRPGIAVTNSPNTTSQLSEEFVIPRRRRASWSPPHGSRVIENPMQPVLVPVDGPGFNPSMETIQVPGGDSLPPASSPRLDRTKQLFEAKREARRLRRNLKASGDFLGVQGVNPHTGELDVITTTSGSSEGGLQSPNSEIKQLITQETQVDRKAGLQLRGQEKTGGTELEMDGIRKVQRHAKTHKEDAQWSSVAEPKLSPISQSSRSYTPPDPNSSTIRRKPLPAGPFLGKEEVVVEHYHIDGPHQCAFMAVQDRVLAPLTSRTNQPLPSTPKRQFIDPVESPVTAISFLSRPKSIRFQMPPVIPRRSGPSRKDTSPVKGTRFKDRCSRQEKLVDVVTPPQVGRTERGRGISRIPSARLGEDGAETWADRVLRDINSLGRSISRRGSSSDQTEWHHQTSITESVYTPTTTTTGSGESRSIRGAGKEEYKRTPVLNTGILVSQAEKPEEKSTLMSNQLSHQSSVGVPGLYFDLLASPPRLPPNVWPSIVGNKQQHSNFAKSTVETVGIVPRPRLTELPAPLPSKVTTSGRPSTPTREQCRKSSQPPSKEGEVAYTEEIVQEASVPPAVEARTTVQRATSSPGVTNQNLTGGSRNDTSRISMFTCRPSPSCSTIKTAASLDLDLLAADAEKSAKQNKNDGVAMAQGAARMAFIQHAANVRVVDVGKTGTGDETGGVGAGAATGTATATATTMTAASATTWGRCSRTAPAPAPPSATASTKVEECRQDREGQGEAETEVTGNSRKISGAKQRGLGPSACGHSDSGDTGGHSGESNKTSQDGKKPELLPGHVVQMVAGTMLGFGESYWYLVGPVFDADSEPRKRFVEGKSTWGDCGLYMVAVMFMLVAAAVGVWSVRAAALLVQTLRSIVTGFVILVGL